MTFAKTLQSPTVCLVHCQSLTQIPREIRIELAHHGHVIRQQLQRQHTEQCRNLRVRLGEHDHIVRVGAQAGIFFGDDNGPCAAHFHFIDTADDERIGTAI